MKKVIIIEMILMSSLVIFAQVKHRSANTKATSLQTAAFKESVARGKTAYTTYCVSCHQADGGGVQNMNPPLIKTSYVLGDKNRLIKVVLNGFKENVDIDGESYTNNMPPLNFLKDQEIADVLTFIRNNFGNKASAIQVKEVTAVRSGLKK